MDFDSKAIPIAAADLFLPAVTAREMVRIQRGILSVIWREWVVARGKVSRRGCIVGSRRCSECALLAMWKRRNGGGGRTCPSFWHYWFRLNWNFDQQIPATEEREITHEYFVNSVPSSFVARETFLMIRILRTESPVRRLYITTG